MENSIEIKRLILERFIGSKFPEAPEVTISAIAKYIAEVTQNDLDLDSITNKVNDPIMKALFMDMDIVYKNDYTLLSMLKYYDTFLNLFSQKQKIVRFKTAAEFEQTFGKKWREIASFPKRLDSLLGRVISKETLAKHLKSPSLKIPVETIGGYLDESSKSRIAIAVPMAYIGTHMFVIEDTTKASLFDYSIVQKLQRIDIVYKNV